MRVARVIVDVSARSVDRPFDYLIPDRLADSVDVGVPVSVDLAGRTVVGYVVSLASGSDYELKPIGDVLGAPLFREYAPALAEWIAEEYLCPLNEALRLCMPPGGTPRITTREVVDPDGAVHTVRELSRPAAPAVEERWVTLMPDAESHTLPRNATRMRAVLDSLSAGPVWESELRAELGTVRDSIDRLREKGLVRAESRRRMRSPERGLARASAPADANPEQRAALDAIGSLDAGESLLIEGVTGSGKTEVYLQAIAEELDAGRGAIVLVPEISLTPQTVGRFRARFGDRVAVLHSGLGAGERRDQWDLVLAGEADVVVGPRSALFAPVKDLGLVVVDEEHEPSYKQGSSPRYHVRRTAMRLCALTGARLVLGTATPSVETLHLAESGSIAHVVLSERATGAEMPSVEVVDMSAEFTEGHRSMFSRPLIRALAKVASEGEKSLLFLNRRGFASMLLCRECGHVPRCDACSVSMTYHAQGPLLRCHQCDAVRQVPSACPECGSPYLRRFGAGTQRVEDELRSLMPELPVVRMDADTTRGKGGHERRLAEFEALASGVLLGTQMVAKGLDYPEVTLVGVLSADTSLHLPDFRAGERTFQLIEQVAGRAGRGAAPGHVIVQTYWPDHPAILAAASHDRSIFLESELPERRALGYPPFRRLVAVTFTCKASDAAREQAQRLASRLIEQEVAGVDVLGPAPAPLAKVRGSYRWRVTLKAPRDTLPGAITETLKEWRSTQDVTTSIDVDPADLL